MVAIKVERVDSKKQVLKLEVAVLKKLQGTFFRFFKKQLVSFFFFHLKTLHLFVDL